ncbi:MAG: Rieske 2Fe-2S domain-containing protein [Mariprofundaceae bacterium]
MSPGPAAEWQRIAAPEEGGAVCFELTRRLCLKGETIEVGEGGFAIRWRGRVHVWLNRCPHAGSPLDWIPGRFFSEDGRALVCHTHHALFDPASGECLAGPCTHGLEPLPFRERPDGALEVPRRL